MICMYSTLVSCNNAKIKYFVEDIFQNFPQRLLFRVMKLIRSAHLSLIGRYLLTKPFNDTHSDVSTMYKSWFNKQYSVFTHYCFLTGSL